MDAERDGRRRESAATEPGAVLPAPLRRAMGRRPGWGARLYDAAGYALVGVAWLWAALRRVWGRREVAYPRVVPGPDGTRIVLHGLAFRHYAGTTYGNVIHLAEEPAGEAGRLLLNHEYVHVLQVRAEGLPFVARYLLAGWRARRRGEDPYSGNAYERQAREATALLAERPDLPDLWDSWA